MWPDYRLQNLLGIEHPIIQAPMQRNLSGSILCLAWLRRYNRQPFSLQPASAPLSLSRVQLQPRGAARHTPGGSIPPHDGQGPMHVAFSISPDELAAWQEHLQAAGVNLEGRTQWPRGGVSVYFRDPDGHLLEIATPGLWKGY